ncbi:hypothetical protein D8I24_6615 (plasmid) [Cupriavidus necator H850]|nr:hypothetical protein D8I24_6615 [Cupriavidus necator H850]
MTNTTAANGKEVASHGVPAEDDYSISVRKRFDWCIEAGLS